MQYQEAKDAKAMPGVRLAMNKGQPGLWGQAARQLLEYKGIPYVPVAQYPAAPNEDLFAWTGCRNAPVLVIDDAPPVSGWREIINVTERLKAVPALLPHDLEERDRTLHIVEQLAGERGYAWSGRLIIFDRMKKHGGAQSGIDPDAAAKLRSQYGYSEDAAAQAPEQCAGILKKIASQLRAQRRVGSSFLVGSTVTAADIYWACFSTALEPWPPWALSEAVRKVWRAKPATSAHTDDENLLLEHRDQMLRQYLSPIDF